MRNKKLISVIVIFFILFGMQTISIKAEDSKGVILIDAGHGGIDGGAQSKGGTIEKDINLAISKKLKDKLNEEGYTVYVTRDDDIELSKKKVEDLSKRCNMKKETNCDVFVSIHQNKFTQEKCYGAQVWYSNNEKSEKLANLIQNSLKEKIDDKNKRVAKPAKDQYKILRDGYDGACVLVECGFISNYAEEQRLKSDDHQNKIVEGITCAINDYFENK